MKIGLIGWLVWSSLEEQAGILPEMTYMTVQGHARGSLPNGHVGGGRALPVALAIAVLDYAYQWWQLQEKMMMTTEEIKKEHKDTEGDPLRAPHGKHARSGLPM